MDTPRVKAWLIASQLLALFSLPPWLVLAGLAFHAFEAPGAEHRAGPWLVAAAVWLYPLLPLLTSLFAWRAYRRTRRRQAALLSAIPLGALAVLLYLAYVWS